MSPWAQPHCAVGGENQGSDQHKGLSAAPGASRSHQPCNSPSLDSWSRLPSTTYFSVCSAAETINKSINKLPPGKSTSYPGPFGFLHFPKLSFTSFLSGYCNGSSAKETHHILSSTTLLTPISTKWENRAPQEMRINTQRASVLTPRAAVDCQEPAVNLTIDCWPHIVPSPNRHSASL